MATQNIVVTQPSKFTLNGKTYARIYHPLAQGDENIGLYNIYTTQQLLSSTHYSDFVIDGVVPTSRDEALELILTATYSITAMGIIGDTGPQGEKGDGWTGGAYDQSTGVVTFSSNDGLGFSTGDLRGAQGPQGPQGPQGEKGDGWTGGSYDQSTGIVTFLSNDGLGFATGDLRGEKGDKGDGWTGGSYDPSTGIVTFTSNDGLGFATGDLRGAQGPQGDTGPGWTGGSYDPNTGVVTFTSNDGLGFATGDLRGPQGPQGEKGDPGSITNASAVDISLDDSNFSWVFGADVQEFAEVVDSEFVDMDDRVYYLEDKLLQNNDWLNIDIARTADGHQWWVRIQAK